MTIVANSDRKRKEEEEEFRKWRAMSLPDMTELSDIVALDDMLSDDDDDENVENNSPQNHPARLFSVGLHRSMSMPKQQQKGVAIEEDEEKQDDFYFPEDESEHSAELQQQDSFLPKFYSEETLSNVITPSGKKMSPKIGRRSPKVVPARMKRMKSKENVEPDSEKEAISGSLRDAAAKKAAQRDAALSSLSAFFGAGGSSNDDDDEVTSPTSAIQFPTLHTRSESLPSRAEGSVSSNGPIAAREAASSPSPQRRSIFAKTYAEPSSSNDDFEFKMLQSNDRTTSMPAKLPSSKMPRKPSLKKVSSFVGDAAKNETSNGIMKPSVSFSNLQIREYDVTLGDNPSCSYGPPVSLGWDYSDTEVVPLEKYERARSNKFPRRKPRQLVLSYNVRKYLLLKTAGYTKAELREAMEEVKRIKHERKMTDMMLPLDEVMEGVIDHVKGMFQQKK